MTENEDRPTAAQAEKPEPHKLLKPGDPVPVRWRKWFDADKRHTAPWRKEAREANKFRAGQHWSEEDKQKLRDEMRPAITFDRSSVIVDAISGQEIQNRQMVAFLPREEGDAIPNELYTEAARWFDQQAEAEDEDSEAFVDCLWTGMGWSETRLNTDNDPQGDPEVECIDGLEMYWDASATKSGLRDARRMWRLKKFVGEEAMERFPGFTLDQLRGQAWSERNRDGEININDPLHRYEDFDGEEDTGGYSENSGMKGELDRFVIAHLQYWVYEPYVLVADPFSGQMQEFTEKEYATLQKNLKAVGFKQPLEAVTLKRRVFYQAFLGKVVLEHGLAPCKDHFSWACVTGKRDRHTGVFYGLYRALKDPQMWANKWLSQLLHIMNSNAKGGLLYEQGAFVDQEEAERQWAKPGGMVEVRPGAILAQKIKERQMSPIPAGFTQLTEFAITAIRDVVGVNLELLGMREANQAGVLEYQRRQAGLTILAPLFNSLRRYRRARGHIMLYFIQNFLADGRLIKITGKDKAQYVPLLKQTDAKFDIIVDDAPYAPNQKEIVWQSLTQILPGVKDIIPPDVLLQLLDYSPLPASVVQKIKEVVTADTPEKRQAKQLQARAAIAEVMNTEAEAELKSAQSVKAIADARAAGLDQNGEEVIDVDEPTPDEVNVNLAKADDLRASAGLKVAQTDKVLAEIDQILVGMDKAGAETDKIVTETSLLPAELKIREKQANKPVARPSAASGGRK